MEEEKLPFPTRFVDVDEASLAVKPMERLHSCSPHLPTARCTLKVEGSSRWRILATQDFVNASFNVCILFYAVITRLDVAQNHQWGEYHFSCRHHDNG